MPEELPDLTLGPFRLWVLGREFPRAQDFWDGNWLVVAAECDLHRAKVTIQGPYLHLSEFGPWKRELEEMDRTLSGSASIGHIEPNLRIGIEAKQHGHLDVTVQITPDQTHQHHRFQFELDQTYLTALISEVTAVLRLYPVRV